MGGEQFMKHCEICKRLQYMHIADKECDSCKVDRLREERDRLQKELKREVNTRIEVQFNYFAEADVWKGTANALASELDKAEKERDRYRELLQRVIEE